MNTSQLGDLRVWCTELELSEPRTEVLQPLDGLPYRQVRVLVRLHGEPMGYVRVPMPHGYVRLAALVEAVRVELLPGIEQHLRRDGLPVAFPRPGAAPAPASEGGCHCAVPADRDVSVIVCTRNRSEILRACLDHLRRLRYRRLEVIIVDNAPVDDSTRIAFEAVVGDDPRFRYTVESRPGLSCARNRGLREATGDIVAYTDDDVTVDPHWISGLLRGFQRRADVGCVTGLVCTASINGPVEAYFDARVTWSTRCESRLYDLRPGHGENRLYPYSPGIFGTGANFAFDTEMLRRLGGFDEALGAGTRTAGGEDLDAFVRVLQTGRALAYEPAAVVWHHHRSTLRELRDQMYAYGTGLSAFLVKHIVSRPTRTQVLARIPDGVVRLARVRATTRMAMQAGHDAPKGVLLRELCGFAMGPICYLRARRSVPSKMQSEGS